MTGGRTTTAGVATGAGPGLAAPVAVIGAVAPAPAATVARTRPSGGRSRARPHLPAGGAWVLVVVAAGVVRLPGYFRSLFDSDEAVIATTGMVVARGGALYRDVIDRKPPLAPFLYAASFLVTGSRSIEPLHLLVALELVGAALLVAAEARRVAGARAGWWAAGLLVAGAVASRPVAGQAANFSQIALLPGCAAIVVARHRAQLGRGRRPARGRGAHPADLDDRNGTRRGWCPRSGTS